jgi:hypothetical protein
VGSLDNTGPIKIQKMRSVKILFISLLFIGNLSAQNIPNGWVGDWYGILEISNPKGQAYKINMELHLAKTDTANKWTYTIIYDNGSTKDERKYSLIKKDSLSGLYEIDENNGIVINEVQIGNKMFQRFEVMDNMIYGIVTYEKGKITWEIISDNKNLNFKSGNGDEGIPFVITYYPMNYQKAVLTKKKPKPIKLQKTGNDKK